MNEEPEITIGATGIDTEALVQHLRETVARKQAEGVYADARIARAERTNLLHLRNDEDFLAFYLQSLREAATVDINDFDIRERRAGVGPLLVRLKKTIWNLLKFYTYRLWSQQNTINSLFVTGLESMDDTYKTRLQQLEARIAALEKDRTSPPAP
ncbi:MAG: hypothetical protein H7A43_10950 [Verrucomicrobia bacterium]|nr:hypothetical protein [Kiritimatiellia bacterium]MCB1102903.1 hypothetical protein [Kiritimatiellia bacterium]MCP5489150.1 hypothetical protein [Verrucomicrobiota bacterium]